MSRLRRLNGSSGFVPVAAEVLESRALLSGAAAAVHVATHHAAAEAHAIEPLTSHATVAAAFSINGGPIMESPGLGNLTLSKFSVADGSKVTIKVSFTAKSEALKATFTGTINSFSVNGINTFITLDPTGGSMTFSGALLGIPTKAVALPDGSQWHLQLQNGTFQLIAAHEVFTPTTGGGLAKMPIDISIGFL